MASPLVERAMICTFCGTPAAEVPKLIAGPPPHAVCSPCVELLSEVEAASQDGTPRAPSPGACTFCGGEGLTLILPAIAHSTPPSAICPDCLDVCRQVLAG